MEPRFEPSTKNRPVLVLNNYRYTHYHKNNRQISHWRCDQYHKGCRAQIKTYENKIMNDAHPVHKHSLASSAIASRAHAISTPMPKDNINLNKKIAILEKLLAFKSTVSKAISEPSSEEISDFSDKDQSSGKKKHDRLRTNGKTYRRNYKANQMDEMETMI